MQPKQLDGRPLKQRTTFEVLQPVIQRGCTKCACKLEILGKMAPTCSKTILTLLVGGEREREGTPSPQSPPLNNSSNCASFYRMLLAIGWVQGECLHNHTWSYRQYDTTHAAAAGSQLPCTDPCIYPTRDVDRSSALYWSWLRLVKLLGIHLAQTIRPHSSTRSIVSGCTFACRSRHSPTDSTITGS